MIRVPGGIGALSRPCFAFALVATLTMKGEAQGLSPTQIPPVFSAETRLVHVDAVVTDRRGAQVTDLVASDFEIESGGSRIRASVATYVPLVGQDVPATGAAGRKLRARDIRRAVTFLVARPVIETRSGSNIQANMFAARRVDRMLRQFIDHRATQQDLVAIVNADSRKPLLNQFTASTEALNLAADVLRTEWNNPDTQPLMLMGSPGPLVRYCLEVVELAGVVVERLSNLPGRRLLFLVSTVLPMGGSHFSEVKRAVEDLAKRANRAGVTIYGVGPGGLGSGSSEALRYLAEETGGSTIENTELLGDNLAKVMETNSGYYLLGYDPGDRATDIPARVKVSVRRDGLRVAARRQANAFDSARIGAGYEVERLSLESLLNSPVAADGINTRITPHIRWTGEQKGEFLALITIEPDPADRRDVDLDVLVRVVDQRGSVVRVERTGLKSLSPDDTRSPFRLMVKAPLEAPGVYQADVAVEDKRTRRQGSATSLASFPNLRAERDTLFASSMVLRPTGDRDGLPADTFPRHSMVTVSCEVAHAQRHENNRQARLQVQFRIRKEGRSVMVLEPIQLVKDLPPLIKINGELTLADLPVGDYVAEVEITDLLGKPGRNQVTVTSQFAIADTR